MALTLTRDSVHAGDDWDAPHEVRPELPPDADLGDLTAWIVDHRYLPTSGLGGTWVLFHGARRGVRAPADDRRPAAAVSWWTYQPPEVAFILPPDTPIDGWSRADLTHGHRGGAQKVAERWGAPRPG